MRNMDLWCFMEADESFCVLQIYDFAGLSPDSVENKVQMGRGDGCEAIVKGRNSGIDRENNRL